MSENVEREASRMASVLIVHEDNGLGRLFAVVLEQGGHLAVACKRVDEMASWIAKRGRPDLVITHLGVGYSAEHNMASRVMDELNRLECDSPVVVVTGGGLDGGVVRALTRRGVRSFIALPYGNVRDTLSMLVAGFGKGERGERHEG